MVGAMAQILGIDRHKTGRWRARVKVDGHRRDIYAATREGARQRAESLSALDASDTEDLTKLFPDGAGTPEEWAVLLWHTARRLAENPESEALLRLAKALPPLATAAARMEKTRPPLSSSTVEDEGEYHGDPYAGALPPEEP